MGIDLICLFLLTLFGVEGHIVGDNDNTDTTNTIYPFTVPYDEEMVADLYRRLNSTRWPQELQSVTGDHGDWDYGIPRHLVQEYVDYLFHNYSWKLQVKKLNEMSQYQTTIDDYNIHFIHQKSSYPNAVPLLFLHGWPGSFWECSKILPMLTEPHKYGGKRENSFHVICPSIPGYGYSSSPKKKGFDQYECALLFTKLMDRLGYPKYYLQGGDWGSTIASLQASLPENSNKILGLHLNMVPVALPYAKGIFPLLSSLLSLVLPWFYFTTTERKLLNELPLKILQETGYFHEQSTRPLTLSYSLSDSPVGLLAWIGEKFYVWSDCTRKDFQIIHPPDEFLTNFMIYWSTNTVGTVLPLILLLVY